MEMTKKTTWLRFCTVAIGLTVLDARSGILSVNDRDNEDVDTRIYLLQCRDSVDLGISWRMLVWRSEHVLLAEARRRTSWRHRQTNVRARPSESLTWYNNEKNDQT